MVIMAEHYTMNQIVMENGKSNHTKKSHLWNYRGMLMHTTLEMMMKITSLNRVICSESLNQKENTNICLIIQLLKLVERRNLFKFVTFVTVTKQILNMVKG